MKNYVNVQAYQEERTWESLLHMHEKLYLTFSFMILIECTRLDCNITKMQLLIVDRVKTLNEC